MYQSWYPEDYDVRCKNLPNILVNILRGIEKYSYALHTYILVYII
jgi:hypothetical protein